MDVIKRNFLRLIQAGAFGDVNTIEPMSRFKWEIIFHAANIHNVIGIVFRGIENNQEYTETIPQDITDKYRDMLYDNEVANIRGNNFDAKVLLRLPDAGLAHMCNRFLNARLQAIREKEPFEEDQSVETLNMLDILVQATECTMTYGLSFANILRIGMFLRSDGDKVDFIKLDRWLHRLNISRMAQLEGSILIEIFGFEREEIPFVEKKEPSARKFAIHALEKPIRIDIEEWKISQKSTIFLANNSKAMMKTIRNCMKYFFFAPVEASSNFMHRFVNSLSNLEE